MNWLAWRQFRKQFMIFGIILALFAAVMIPTGLHFWHTYQYTLSTCGKTDTCNQINGELLQSNGDQTLENLTLLGTLIMPIILGLFIGVPLLTREYADGTNKLVWTQGISRRKWLTTKLIWTILGAAILAAGFAILNTWWSKTGNALNLDRFDPAKFESQGIVPIGYTVFAVATGIALGAWLKRIMLALGVTFVLMIAIVLIIVPNFVRPNYEKPISYNTSLLSNVGPNSSNSLSLAPASSGASLVATSSIINSKNQPLNWANPPSKCIVTMGPNGNPVIAGHTTAAVKVAQSNGSVEVNRIEAQNGGPPVSFNCLSSLGYTQNVKYQPSYRYWNFQRIETAMYLALSIIPIGATYWLVLRRDA